MRRNRLVWTFTALLFALAAVAALGACAPARIPAPDAALARTQRMPAAVRVPSPDWRDQIIYFVLIDRFDDGDPGNNDQGADEFRPESGAHYSGGDLAGLLRRLDYIQGLGATALWITPPVRHQWWNEATQYGGYHGYWADDFASVDPHFGTLADYRALADALHARGMFLVQDIVVNHTANYFTYDAPPDPADSARGWRALPDRVGRVAPIQAPFHLNDPRRAEDRRSSIYHWTGPIIDYTDREQELTGQMAGLDDLNTENPAVRRALRKAYGHWIKVIGVDAFRVDTAFYVPPDFFDDFLDATDPEAPGIRAVARAAGRDDFLVFGEGYGIDRPYQDLQSRKIAQYLVREDGSPRLPSMIHFPLYGTLGDVFARGRPTRELADRITRSAAVFPDPHRMPTFIDNHDVDRFLAGGSEAGLRQALLALMTLPGIPTIYYGTEQGFRVTRQAMFAGGWGSGGRDHFDTEAPLYRAIAALTKLRREHAVLRRGLPVILRDTAAGPGALAWAMRDGDAQALVVVNTADHPVLLDALATGLAPGTRLAPAHALVGPATMRVVGAEGMLDLVLPAREGLVLVPTGDSVPVPRSAASERGVLTLDPLPPRIRGGRVCVAGTARGRRAIRLVLDGDLAQALHIPVGRDGRWSATLDVTGLVDPAVRHRLVAWAGEGGAVSTAREFAVEPDWQLAADVADPAFDDHGPAGRYRYPDDPSWGDNRQADLRRVRAWTAGGSLKLELTMARVTNSWNPANGFDHVAFSVAIELPGRDGGVAGLPQMNHDLPDSMRWHYRLRTHGWSNALFHATGAGAQAEGEVLSPGAEVTADVTRGTVTVLFPAAALGRAASLDGARVHVATWDYDARWRALTPAGGSHAFGGGDGAVDPLVMDESAAIRLQPAKR